MQTRTRDLFLTVRTEGAILPSDLLERIAAGDPDLGGLTPEAYHLPDGEKITETTNRAWNRLLAAWSGFRSASERLPATDAGTTLTREKWLLPLFQELGYGRLLTVKAVEIDGKSYAISHGWNRTPIHLLGCRIDLNTPSQRVAGASRSSPHSLLQEFLNRSPGAPLGHRLERVAPSHPPQQRQPHAPELRGVRSGSDDARRRSIQTSSFYGCCVISRESRRSRPPTAGWRSGRSLPVSEACAR